MSRTYNFFVFKTKQANNDQILMNQAIDEATIDRKKTLTKKKSLTQEELRKIMSIRGLT